MGIINLLLLLAAAPGLTFSPAKAGQLILRVFDAAHLPAPILQRAIRRVESAFEAAGIAAEWLPACSVVASPDHPSRADCAQASPDSPDPIEICIVDNNGVSHTLNSDILGSTNLSVHRAYILWGHIKRSALATATSADVVLARVILHEIGHAAGLDHAPSGIMRPQLSPDALKSDRDPTVTFTPDEANQISSLRSSLLSAFIGVYRRPLLFASSRPVIQSTSGKKHDAARNR
jgi:hypothetical protein